MKYMILSSTIDKDVKHKSMWATGRVGCGGETYGYLCVRGREGE